MCVLVLCFGTGECLLVAVYHKVDMEANHDGGGPAKQGECVRVCVALGAACSVCVSFFLRNTRRTCINGRSATHNANEGSLPLGSILSQLTDRSLRSVLSEWFNSVVDMPVGNLW